MNAQQPITLPRIGQLWPEQGGIFIGVIPGQNGDPDYALIAPDDTRTLFENAQWGTRGQNIPGAASDWDGVTNTVAMAEAGSDLAQNILTLDIDGRTDFYLPARHELRLIKLVASHLVANDWHWSSTQFSARYAWCQDFGGGPQDHYGKAFELRARAVRRFLINSIIQ